MPIILAIALLVYGLVAARIYKDEEEQRTIRGTVRVLVLCAVWPISVPVYAAINWRRSKDRHVGP